MTAPLATPLVLVSDFDYAITKTTNVAALAATNAAILNKIVEESDRIQRWCFRRFDERVNTGYFTARHKDYGGHIDGYDLLLDDDLRSVTTLTNGDGAVLSSGYTLLPRSADSNGVAVKDRVRLSPTGSVRWTYTDDPVEAITLLGLWGYGGQWKSTGYTVSSGLSGSAGATSFVSSGALEAGMTLKIGSEYMYVSATSGTPATTNTADRGVNGSTAAVHADASAIYRWEALPLIQRHVKRLVLISILQDSSPLFSTLIINDSQAVVASDGNPRDVLYDVKNAGLRREPGVMAV